jgi:hypothetical protein
MEIKLEGIAPEACELTRAFFGRIAELLGESLVAGLLSGDATGPAFKKGRDVASPLLLVDRVTERLLVDVGLAWKKAAGGGVEPPLVLTAAELEGSLDAYPVEFLAIRETGRVVCGEFDLAGLDIRTSDLRLQCERELRGLLIHARMAAIRLGNDEKALGALMAVGAGRLVVIARAVVLLLGADPRGDAELVLARLSELLDGNADILGAIVLLRGAKRPRFSGEQLGQLMELLEILVHRIDSLDGEGKA